MGQVYSKKDQKDINKIKDLQVLKPLLTNIQEQEKAIVSKMKKKDKQETLNIDFNKDFIIFSNKQIYRTYSIIGIMKTFSRNIRYNIIDLDYLLDVWYNSSGLLTKDAILNCDLLIIHGEPSLWQLNNKVMALKELITIRKTLNRKTWVFIEQANEKKFEEYYPKVINMIGNSYNSEF